jgi:hypothetical protein
MKRVFKAPRPKNLKPQYDVPPSNFAFKFNLRRYTLGFAEAGDIEELKVKAGR